MEITGEQNMFKLHPLSPTEIFLWRSSEQWITLGFESATSYFEIRDKLVNVLTHAQAQEFGKCEAEIQVPNSFHIQLLSNSTPHDPSS